MPAGEAFSEDQKHQVERATSYARRVGDVAVSVYVGELGATSRKRALQLHAAFGAEAPSTVLVAADPGSHRLEIVTGSAVARRLDDRTCSLVAVAMTSAFAVGDLVGGLVTGVQQLGDHARTPKVLHADSDL